MKVSIVKNTRHVKAPMSAELEQVAKRIMRGDRFQHDTITLEARIAELRTIDDEQAARKYKSDHLPAFVPSGVFSHRSQNGLEEHSGYISLDFDKVTDMPELQLKCNAHKATVLSFISPSGNGLKVLAKVNPIPKDRWQHQAAWKVVNEVYSAFGETDADDKCKNLDRLCYFSHDPLVVFRTDKEAESIVWNVNDTVYPPSPQSAPAEGDKTLKDWLLDNGIDYTDAGTWTGNYGTGNKYQVDCPINTAHKRPDAFVTDAGGPWTFSCSHNSCSGKGWREFKDALGIKDPLFQKPRPKTTSTGKQDYVGGLPKIEDVDIADNTVKAEEYPTFPRKVMSSCKVFDHYVTAHIDRNEICMPFLFAMGVTQVGAMLGRSVWIEGQPKPLYPNIYAVLLGKSTVSRKTTAKDLCIDQLNLLNAEEVNAPDITFTSSVSTPEGLIDMLKTEEVLMMQKREEDEDGNKRTVNYKETVVVHDNLPEFEGIRLMLHIDEMKSLFAKRLQRSSAGVIAKLTEAYGNPLKLNVPSKTSNQTAMYPTVNILGCTTKAWFEQGIRTEDIHGGFANRFMFFTHEQMPLVDFAKPPETELMDVWLNHVYRVRAEYEGRHQRFSMSQEVLDSSRDLYHKEMDRLINETDEIILSASARIREQVMKLALIFSVLENDIGDTTVHYPAWQRAVEVGEYLLGVNEVLFASLVRDERGENERRVLDALAKQDNKATRRELRARINTNTMSSRALNEAIESLLNSEELLTVTDGRKRVLVKVK